MLALELWSLPLSIYTTICAFFFLGKQCFLWSWQIIFCVDYYLNKKKYVKQGDHLFFSFKYCSCRISVFNRQHNTAYLYTTKHWCLVFVLGCGVGKSNLLRSPSSYVGSFNLFRCFVRPQDVCCFYSIESKIYFLFCTSRCLCGDSSRLACLQQIVRSSVPRRLISFLFK